MGRISTRGHSWEIAALKCRRSTRARWFAMRWTTAVFKTAPEVKNNCVRVHYDAGYHVDVPVYRRVVDEKTNAVYFELASSAGWKRSDARDVTDWYEETRSSTSDQIQFLRLNRHLKKHAKSRESWKSRNLSGFGITALLAENHVLVKDREDLALYRTMEAIKIRLDSDTVIDHPVTPNETITSGDPDAKATFFRERLGEALNALVPLFGGDCDREKALKCWDKVFNTTFFSERYEAESQAKSAAAAPAVKSSSLRRSTVAAGAAVSTTGGGRYA